MPDVREDRPRSPGQGDVAIPVAVYTRLGEVEGKLDFLLKLREEDTTSLRELVQEIRGSYAETGRQLVDLSNRVGAVAEVIKPLPALDEIVRVGPESLLSRITVLEKDLRGLQQQNRETKAFLRNLVFGLVTTGFGSIVTAAIGYAFTHWK